MQQQMIKQPMTQAESLYQFASDYPGVIMLVCGILLGLLLILLKIVLTRK